MNTTTKTLVKLGLKEKEAKFYLATLELGEATMFRIAKKSGLKRATAYDMAESLKEKGLIHTATQKKRTFYYAEDPRVLESQLEEKRQILKNEIPQLLSIANFIDKKPKVKFFESEEGIKDVFRDMLNYPSQEICSWTTETFYSSFDLKFISNYVIPQRIKKKIWVRSIIPDTPQMRKYQKNNKRELRQTKFLSEPDLPIKASLNLYGKNKIGILAFEEQIGLLIESEKTFVTLKSIFEMAWENLPE